jgi:arylformamidase
MKVHDITHMVRPGMAVWPGDTPYRREMHTSFEDGDLVDSSTITISLHTGTHIDAPGHYLKGAATVDALDPSLFVGPAEVVTVQPRNGSVQAGDLKEVLTKRPERLLIHANQPTDLADFPQDYACLSVEAAKVLAASGIRLLGIDSPSVDSYRFETLSVHEVLGRAGIVILENLRMTGVSDGAYQLVALPLKLAGADGSPVRAVLIES